MLKRGHERLLLHHTSLKIGGRASCWLEPENFDDVVEAISVAERERRPLAVIGKGTNILAQDKGFDGVLINLTGGFDYIKKEADTIVNVGAATLISRVLEKCADWGLGGCEFLAGIPGSSGGAIFMNAGVRDINDPEEMKQVKDIIIDVDVVDLKDKKRKNLQREEIDFSYRSSGLDGKCILGARIKLEKTQKSDLVGRIDSYMKNRQWIQRLGFPSAGSVFKNPDNKNTAGRLIEKCELKGKRVGGAGISTVHANFIVNTGGAKSKDVMKLIDLAQKSVKQKFNIDLELELKVLS